MELRRSRWPDKSESVVTMLQRKTKTVGSLSGGKPLSTSEIPYGIVVIH